MTSDLRLLMFSRANQSSPPPQSAHALPHVFVSNFLFFVEQPINVFFFPRWRFTFFSYPFLVLFCSIPPSIPYPSSLYILPNSTRPPSEKKKAKLKFSSDFFHLALPFPLTPHLTQERGLPHPFPPLPAPPPPSLLFRVNLPCLKKQKSLRHGIRVPKEVRGTGGG